MTAPTSQSRASSGLQRVLRGIEVVGNKVPHPFVLFLVLISVIAVASLVLDVLGVTATSPNGEVIEVRSLLSTDGIRMALDTALENFMLFSPFGTVLVIMMGVSVATQTGYLQSLLTGIVNRVPKKLVTFSVSYLAMIAHVAGDASIVIMAPLGAIAFHLVGRSPITGMVLAYVSAAAAYAASPSVTPSDAMFSGLSTEAAQLAEPGYVVSPISTIFFTAASSVVMALALTLVCELVITRRVAALGEIKHLPHELEQLDSSSAGGSARERRATRWASVLLLAYVALVLLALIPSWSPLRTADGELEGGPVFAGIAVISSLMFIVAGVVYGKLSGRITSVQNDLPKHMAHGVHELAPIIVLFLVISQFTAYFNWTNLARVMSIKGAELLQQVNMPTLLLLLLIIVTVSVLDVVTLGGAAMYAMVGLVLVPMLFSVGVSPETTQTVYRIGDSITNPVNPFNPYFLWVLTLLKRYLPNAGIGTLASMTVPLALGAGAIWIVFFLIWTALGIPLGP
ncbi:AbgT family transporter [Prauserella cavernicola]|uniref:AbgT family transporter n=1 Tax=Prauserella cavernicola TaxID=2800127 RepID=A0A934V4N7_9PSEU|nr:AbgT family transporter [Prauserella cavernicola]MBK1783778.1 AbgT family transporter [Prauserella cavernicola]